MSGATPDWADILEGAIRSALLDVHTAMPGQIVALYTDDIGQRQSADVRPSLRRVLPASDDVDTAVPYVEEDLPIIPRVPIAYPQGGRFAVTWPLEPGDFVLLVFAERSLDLWLATARKAQQKAITLAELGTHTLDGAIALPLGPAPYGELLGHVTEDALTLGHEAGKRVYIREATIALGSSSPSDAVALASKVTTEDTALAGNIGTLKTATIAALTAIDAILSTTTAATFTSATAALPHTVQSVASDVVKTD